MRDRMPFCQADSDLSIEEFDLAISGLKDKGLVEEIMIDGVQYYLLTEMGAMIGSHMDSDSATHN